MYLPVSRRSEMSLASPLTMRDQENRTDYGIETFHFICHLAIFDRWEMMLPIISRNSTYERGSLFTSK